MAQEKLDALSVKRAHAKGLPVILNDGGGLYFRKQTKSGAAWMLRYRFAGKPKWMALGNFPDMSLAQARKEARVQRVLLDTQRDPLEHRRAEKARLAGRETFGQLAEDWYKAEILGRRHKHPKVPRRYLDNHLLPKLRHKTGDEVATADLTNILDKVKVKHPAAANDLLRVGVRIMNFGMRRRRILGNPWAGLTPRHDGGGTERPRQRALKRDELVTMFKSMRDATAFGQLHQLATKLLLALLVRKMQLISAKKEEFDLEGKTDLGPRWRLPVSRSKTEPVFIDIPLVPSVVAWLRTLFVLAGDSDYLFPRLRHDSRTKTPHMGKDTLNAALKNVEHGLDHFTVHDWRRTARTHLSELGVSRAAAERSLSHKIKGVEGTYDTHHYFDERRSALEQWTQILLDADQGVSRPKKEKSK